MCRATIRKCCRQGIDAPAQLPALARLHAGAAASPLAAGGPGDDEVRNGREHHVVGRGYLPSVSHLPSHEAEPAYAPSGAKGKGTMQ